MKDLLVDTMESDFGANLAEQQGGGMYISVPSSMQFLLRSVGVIKNSTFDGNTARFRGEYTYGKCHCFIWSNDLLLDIDKYIIQMVLY